VGRQAICRCPRCHEFFCRECVVEHDSQYVCSACLGRLEAPAEARASGIGKFFAKVLLPVLGAGAFLGAWFVFYLIGQWLLRSKSG
jgi:hypothetical protein